MKFFLSVACVLSILVAISLAAPATLLDAENSFISPVNDQVIDMVVQNVTSTVFRVVGGALLRSGGLGGGRSGSGSVSVVLPTFPPDEDYEDEEENEETNKIDSGDTEKAEEKSDSDNTTTTSTTSAAPFISLEPSVDDSSLDEETELNRQVRTAREAQDQDSASSNVVPNPENDLSNVDTEDADRDKRYSAFGGDGQGSGNFLFDLVRNGADRVARAAGTVYRMVAGTENLGFGLPGTATNTRTLVPAVAVPIPQLITGSGGHDQGAGAGGVAEIDVAPRSESAEGIPGPITRLLVVANRGIANLIQDLILRLAQTSERIVNFKARLITALI